MILYMAMDIAKIIILYDETGVNSVGDFILYIELEAFSSHERRVKFQFLKQSFRALSKAERTDSSRGSSFYS